MQTKRKNNKFKINRSQIIKFGSFFLIMSGILLIIVKYSNYYMQYQTEQNLIEEFIEEQILETSQDTININSNTVENDKLDTKKESSLVEYIAVLEIPKINLRKGLFDKKSLNNNVEKNIQILDESDMPDKDYGNFILASHSGTSNISHFKNLEQLDFDDTAIIYYKNSKNIYKLVNFYEIEKSGEANIVRNLNKTTLTLITCKRNSEKQIIFIFERIDESDE